MEKMTETFRLILTKFTDEALIITGLVMVLVFVMLILYWLYNRRRFNQLRHQIPARVMKNYLDSIIENSTALKSSLMRGEDGVPSVMSLKDLPANASNSKDSSGDLESKNAEISSLRSQIQDKDKHIRDLEKNLESASSGDSSQQDQSGLIQALRDEIDELKKKLAEKEKQAESVASSEEEGDPLLQEELDKVSKERDELKERLQEYEIIEEDLANLKRFQQENEELKKTVESLKAGGAASGDETPAEQPQEASESEDQEEGEENEELEELENLANEASDENSKANSDQESLAPEKSPDDENKEQPASGKENKENKENDKEQKSAEELLSEFEKMLG